MTTLRTATNAAHRFLLAATAVLTAGLLAAACGDMGPDAELQGSVSTSGVAAALTGDINGDDKLNVVDVQCMILAQKWALAGSTDPMPKCLTEAAAADLNCDGKISVLDYQLMIKLVTGQPLHPKLDANGDGVVDACQPAPVFGDITKDGKLNVVDLQCMTLTLHWTITTPQGPPPACVGDPSEADLNCDGKVTVVDFQLLLKLLKGDGVSPRLDRDNDGVPDTCQQ